MFGVRSHLPNLLQLSEGERGAQLKPSRLGVPSHGLRPADTTYLSSSNIDIGLRVALGPGVAGPRSDGRRVLCLTRNCMRDR
jgi:hypothetical protein